MEFFTAEDYRPYWTVMGVILKVPVEDDAQVIVGEECAGCPKCSIPLRDLYCSKCGSKRTTTVTHRSEHRLLPDITDDLKLCNLGYMVEPFDPDGEMPEYQKVLVTSLLGRWDDHEVGVRAFHKLFQLEDLQTQLAHAKNRIKPLLDKYPGSELGIGLICFKPEHD